MLEDGGRSKCQPPCMTSDRVAHPAKFSKGLIPLFIAELAGYQRIIDPFVGIGAVHVIRDRETVGVDLGSEWAQQHDGTIIGDARWLPFPARIFRCSANQSCLRLADQWLSRRAGQLEAQHLSAHLRASVGRRERRGYALVRVQRALHVAAWKEPARVLKPGSALCSA
jgi:hypothetical protein